ncbi:MAG: efflux RND transporter permease subunit [Bacillota bacterium]|uniref:efflux RND transporter permease subunit n=1 Tax=Desulforudis sp. DRI-14 TaxID=3459793 RepID=UPI003497E81D
MKIVDVSVRRPVAVTMAVLAVLVLGWVSFTRLSIDLMPDMEMPYAAVFTQYPGAGPEEVERTVTDLMEQAVGTVENVTDVISVSKAGSSTVYVGFDWGTDMDFATLKMREKVDIYKPYLPRDAENPMVAAWDLSMMPVAIYGMSGSLDLETLKRTADDVVKPRLERIEGVASVAVQGGNQREIQVLVDPARMQGYGISLSQVVQALRMENLNQSAGKVLEGSKDYLIRVPGEFYDLKDIEGTVVQGAGGVPVRLADFAAVKDTFKENATVSRMNGRPSVAVIVTKQPTANTVEVVREVRKAVEELRKEIPGGIRFEAAFDQAKFIEKSINSMVSHLLAGGLLAVFSIFLFLRSLRSTLIIATSIPFAVIATFTLIYFSGGTLNMMTLGGLALGIGIIVDDAIVVLENIHRHRLNGMGMVEAATFGASEVGGAVLGATTTGIAVFVPIIFVEGLASQLFGPMGTTIGFAIFASFVVAVTLIPMLAARMLVINGKGDDFSGARPVRRVLRRFGRLIDALGEKYGHALAWGMRRRRRVVGLAALLFFVSLLLIPAVGAEFMPAVDEGQVSVRLSMPKGTGLAATDEMVSRVERIVQDIPEVETTMITLGVGTDEERAGIAGSSSDQATIDLMLVPKAERDRTAGEIAEDLRGRFGAIPGADFKVTSDTGMMGGMSGGGLEVRVKGDDLATLDRIADRAVELISAVDGTREVESDLNEGRPEIRVEVDRERAAAYGLSVGYVASAVNAAMNGEVATRYRVGGDEIDVRVQLAEHARRNYADLENLVIVTPMGESVPLRDVAAFAVGEGPSTITRYDQVRTATITGKIAGRDLNSVIKDVRAKLDTIPLPPGYHIEYGGAAEEMMEAFGNLSLALVLAILLVYMLMAIQFESLLSPLAIMFSVPVSLTGMVLGLLLTGRTFSVAAFIGVIVCVGVVVKNAIVLVDYINILRGRGIEREEAIRLAGPVRLRPILMTATATCLAMLPLALGFGEGGESSAPMATVIIGGLVFSTGVSLLLVPAMYSILDDMGQKVRRRVRRLNGTVDNPA